MVVPSVQPLEKVLLSVEECREIPALLYNHKMLFGEGSQAKRIPKAEVKNTFAFCVSVSFAVTAGVGAAYHTGSARRIKVLSII